MGVWEINGGLVGYKTCADGLTSKQVYFVRHSCSTTTYNRGHAGAMPVAVSSVVAIADRVSHTLRADFTTWRAELGMVRKQSLRREQVRLYLVLH